MTTQHKTLRGQGNGNNQHRAQEALEKNHQNSPTEHKKRWQSATKYTKIGHSSIPHTAKNTAEGGDGALVQHPLANSMLYLQQIRYCFFLPWCHEKDPGGSLKQHFLSDWGSTKSKGYARSATCPSQQYQQQQQQQKLEQTIQTRLLAGCQPKHSCLLYTQTEFARMFAPSPQSVKTGVFL